MQRYYDVPLFYLIALLNSSNNPTKQFPISSTHYHPSKSLKFHIPDPSVNFEFSGTQTHQNPKCEEA